MTAKTNAALGACKCETVYGRIFVYAYTTKTKCLQTKKGE